MFILYCTHSWISAMLADGLILIQPPKQLQGMVGLQPNLAVRFDKYSLLMHRIKIKIPAIFFMEWITGFCGWIYRFIISHIWRYYNDKKAYRILAVRPFKMSANSLSCGLPCSLASTPWAMSLYFKFHAIFFWLLNEYQWWQSWHQAKIYQIIRQLSYRFMCEIMTWSDDKTKLIHKNISTRLLLRALEP